MVLLVDDGVGAGCFFLQMSKVVLVAVVLVAVVAARKSEVRKMPGFTRPENSTLLASDCSIIVVLSTQKIGCHAVRAALCVEFRGDFENSAGCCSAVGHLPVTSPLPRDMGFNVNTVPTNFDWRNVSGVNYLTKVHANLRRSRPATILCFSFEFRCWCVCTCLCRSP